MLRKIYILLLFLIFCVSTANAELNHISESAFDNLNLSTLTCDSSRTTYLYKNDYAVIWDHFHNSESSNLYLWKYRSMTTGNYFKYNITDTDKDSGTNTLVFNRPLLSSNNRTVTGGGTVRQGTTAEEYAPDDNAHFDNTAWSFVGDGYIEDSLDGQKFYHPNVRNDGVPAVASTDGSYDDIYKSATLYDRDNNINTIDDNSAVVLCNKFVVRRCGDGRLGFTGDDGIAGTADDEPYNGDIYHGEECDDGNNIDGDGCSSDCKLEKPNVTITASPSSSDSAFDSVIDSTKSSRSNYTEFDDGNGNVQTSDIVFPVNKHYTSSTTVSVKVKSNYSGLKRPDIPLPTNVAQVNISINSTGGGSGDTGGGDTPPSEPGEPTSGDNSGGSSGGSAVCGDGYIESGETCETHQYIHHSRTCYRTDEDGNEVSYDCSYTSLDPVPTVAGCRATDCRYCGDGTLEYNQGEECDNTQSWCNSCRINYNDSTGPGGDGTSIYYSPKKLIGDNQEVYGDGNEKPYFRNVTGYPIYITKEFCLNRVSQVNNLGESFYPRESLNIGTFSLGYCEGPVGYLDAGSVYNGLQSSIGNWTGNTSQFHANEKYVDNKIKVWLDTNGDRRYSSGEPNVEKNIRVSISSVSTVGGGTSMVSSNNKADIRGLSSDGIANQDINKNFIVSSISSTGTSSPLSSYTIKTDNNTIQDIAVEEGKQDVDTLKNVDSYTPVSTIYDLSLFENYNGLSNVFVHNGDVVLNNTSITGSPKTYIINGNLTINGNITSVPSIAFVVKGGNIIIGHNVTKLDGVYISMSNKIKGDGIKTSNKLIVNGALYGNIDDLVKYRTYISDNANGLIDVGTIVNYTSKIYTTPPPLLGKFVSGYMKVWKLPTDR